MYTPTLSRSGKRVTRFIGCSALFLVTSTGVVMAANPGCQVAFHWEAVRAQAVIAHKVHHSAATLARWKVGAAAWSNAHRGKVYVGHPPAEAAMVWKPLTYRCEDIVLLTDFGAPLLAGEAPPEFDAYASAFSRDAPLIDIASVQNAPTAENGSPIPLYGGSPGGVGQTGGPSGTGASNNGPVGPSSFAPVGSYPVPGHQRLLPPKHPPQEVTLLPPPLPPPTVVPTPEPSTMILLGTGLVTLGLKRTRKQTARFFKKLGWRDQ